MKDRSGTSSRVTQSGVKMQVAQLLRRRPTIAIAMVMGQCMRNAASLRRHDIEPLRKADGIDDQLLQLRPVAHFAALS